MAMPPAGWYPDPDPGRAGVLRYWDGMQWTMHEYEVPRSPARRSSKNLALAIGLPIAIFLVLGLAVTIYLGYAIVCGEAPHYCS